MRTAICIPLAALALAAAARADLVNITPAKDNTIFSDSDNSNALGSLYVGETSSASFRRALLSFDVAGHIPAGSTITGVTFVMRCTRLHGASTVELHRLSANWGEGTSFAGDPGGSGTIPSDGDATWNYPFWNQGPQWATPGGDYSATISTSLNVTGTGTITWPSTPQFVADVQSMLDAPGGNFGWIVIGSEHTAGTAKRFASRENSTQPWWPTLSVTYTVPAPGAGALLACSAFGAALRRRRR